MHGAGDCGLHAYQSRRGRVRLSDSIEYVGLRSAVSAVALQCESAGWSGVHGMQNRAVISNLIDSYIGGLIEAIGSTLS